MEIIDVIELKKEPTLKELKNQFSSLRRVDYVPYKSKKGGVVILHIK